MIKNFLFLFGIFICFSPALKAQENEIPTNSIEGFAPDYVGEMVEVVLVEDYVTKNQKVLATAYVQSEDSLFKLSFKNGISKKVILKIDNVESHFYVAPGKHYDVYIPPVDKRTLGAEKNMVTAQILGLKEDDINFKIISFDMWVDDFLSKHMTKLMDSTYGVELDTFSNYVQEHYKEEKDPYFLSYVRYSLGELQLMEKTEDENMKRFMVYIGYIRKFPILYGHDKYMSFITSFYDYIFNRFSLEDEEKIYQAIVQSSPTALHEILKKDKTLENSALRELALIQALGKSYHQKEYPQQMILNVLDSIRNHPLIEHNALIANNIYNKLTDISAGNPIPEFKIKDIDGNTISPDLLKGSYCYLTFFNLENSISNRELKLIADLKEKYGKDIKFVSISVGNQLKQIKDFQKANKGMDWTFAMTEKGSDLTKKFNVKTLPTYFLIGPDGVFIQAPALGPAPNSEYVTIDYQLFEIYKKLNPEKKFKVGQLENN